MAATAERYRLRSSLTTFKIVYIVIAAAAPMASVVGVVPLAFALGSGPSTPAAFAVTGLVLLLFSVGYAAMSRRITNAGGFYTYVVRGLGRVPGIATALVAVLAYNAVAISLVGGVAYFGRLIVRRELGVTLPWEVYAAAAVLLVGVLGYLNVEIGARVLGVLMVAEIVVLVVLDVAMLARNGPAGLPAAAFSPSGLIHNGSLGLGLMFAVQSFIGFESAALYGEETPDPERNVPLSTYLAVIVTAVIFSGTSWLAVGAIGAGSVTSTARGQLGDLFLGLSTGYVGSWLTTAIEVLLVTSLLASLLGIHNAAGRYMYVLGREDILPRWIGRAHPRFHSPARASVVQTTANVAVAGIFALAGLDPYLNLATAMTGLGSLGVILLQTVAAAAIIGYFRRRPDRHWWRTSVAPLAGFAGLTAAMVLALRHYPELTGTDSPVIDALPWLIAATAVAGSAYAFWLRRHRPAVYAAVGDGPGATVEPVGPFAGEAIGSASGKAD